jgi:succinate dehydrogenase / fumarate reductase membrane anchor subunit
MSLTNPLARARGHGSAKSGVHHWYAQRASAVLLIVLSGWFLFAVFQLAGAGYQAAAAFIGHPLNAAFAILLIVALFYHAMLGLQVVIEDYVHHRGAEFVLYVLSRAGAYFGMALGVIQVLRLALGA